MAAAAEAFIAVISAQIYEQRAPFIARALVGERVSFELSTRMQEVERDLSNEYIPDRRADGSIAGVYVLSTDVSERVVHRGDAVGVIDQQRGGRGKGLGEIA